MKRGWLLLAGVALGGCGSGMSDLEQYVAEVKARKSAAIEPIPQVKQYDIFAYVPGERRDPYEPVEPRTDTAGLHPDMNRNLEPLEEYPLDSLRMQGIISIGSRSFALIKAPDNVVHRVGYGDHMGQNYGTVIRIAESEVTVNEILPDGFGGWLERPASLALPEQ